ncbi:hypothetical protein MUK42_30095 [Musa troglodytarum]|uniref:Uncharacterized protein n=1 Tax=Musa troglodytarum TaxID=320322 RepID=A0A9E7KBP4_9LILI|nr:hypothetical protein MUK42_30095 [Musa troglodytarum]
MPRMVDVSVEHMLGFEIVPFAEWDFGSAPHLPPSSNKESSSSCWHLPPSFDPTFCRKESTSTSSCPKPHPEGTPKHKAEEELLHVCIPGKHQSDVDHTKRKAARRVSPGFFPSTLC